MNALVILLVVYGLLMTWMSYEGWTMVAAQRKWERAIRRHIHLVEANNALVRLRQIVGPPDDEEEA